MKNIVLFVIFFFMFVCFTQAKVFYVCGPKDVKKISLTFDDGPGEATEKILKILKQKNVKATFFMLGIRVENNPNIAKAVVLAGHEIANHTYGHVNFYVYKNKDKINKIEKELLKAESIINNILNIKTFLVRFPYGYAECDAIKVAERNGYYVVNWNFGIDWKNMSADKMYEEYTGAIKSGAIFLMHDLPKNDKVLSFLGKFIDKIIAEGYEIVTLSKLLDLRCKSLHGHCS